MAFFSNNFQLPSFTNSQPEQLIKLAENIRKEKTSLSSLLDRIKNKTRHSNRLIDEIIGNIEEEKFTDISLIEWVYCLSNKSEWDELNPEKSQLTSQKIWQFAQQYQPLKQRLFWQIVAFQFDQDEKTLAPSLAQAFDFFEPQNQQDYITLKLINLLLTENYIDIASLCVNQCLQPNKLLHKYSLPYDIIVQDNLTLVTQIQSHFPLALNQLNNPSPEQINFLIDTLENLPPNYQLTAVENLLQHVPPQVAGNYPKLVRWVKNNYILTQNKSIETQLSSSSKLRFKKWIGAVNYKDFAQLIDLIIEHTSVDSVEDRQLEQRKIFWSNYSDRFMRMRILLPFSTIQAFGSDFDLENITQLINDGSESTEVCIVDLDDCFMVEFFRGKGNEVRIFSKTKQIEAELFNSPDVFLKQLRYLPIKKENIHDRCDYWQVDFEAVLREQKITPNDHLQTFQIEANKEPIHYNIKTGLPSINRSEQSIRNRQLYDWEQDILELETASVKYCQRESQRWSSHSPSKFQHKKSISKPRKSNLDFID